MMTKKDYTQFAKVLLEARSNGNLDINIDWIEMKLCEIFAKDNPNFDERRFLKASTPKSETTTH